MAVPGQVFGVTVRLRNSSDQDPGDPRGGTGFAGGLASVGDCFERCRACRPANELTAQFRVTVPENAAYTRPYWHRNDPETEGLNTVDDPRYATLPFPPPPLAGSSALFGGWARGIGGRRGNGEL